MRNWEKKFQTFFVFAKNVRLVFVRHRCRVSTCSKARPRSLVYRCIIRQRYGDLVRRYAEPQWYRESLVVWVFPRPRWVNACVTKRCLTVFVFVSSIPYSASFYSCTIFQIIGHDSRRCESAVDGCKRVLYVLFSASSIQQRNRWTNAVLVSCIQCPDHARDRFLFETLSIVAWSRVWLR